jgi:cytochrome P450
VQDGDRFDIARADRGRLITFGAGIHYCLGANLARAELQEALAFLVERIEDLELAGEPSYGAVTGIYARSPPESLLGRLTVRRRGDHARHPA